MSKESNILLITFYFPPYPGVGGRRWSKFAKYISRKENINLHVVSAQNKLTNIKSSFEQELNNLDFKHITLPSNYPRYLERVEFQKSTLLSKIMFRVQHYLIKKKVKGNYWDLSVFWDSYFKSIIPTIIEEQNISKLIISGPPYKYVQYACDLKNSFSNLEVILDCRDPWNDFNNPKTFSKERHDFEINLEKETFKKVDKIITVSEFQKSLILKTEPNSAPVIVVPNGFDPEDYTTYLEQSNKTDKITLSHFGTLHQQKEYYWKPFFNAYKRLKETNPSIYESIEINLIGYTPPVITEFISNNGLDVNITGMLPPKEAYQFLNEADIALWFKYDGSPGDFATKFGDYIALKKFIWVFSVQGAVTKHIKSNKIGQVFYRDNDNMEDTIYNSFLNLNRTDLQFNKSYSTNQLNIKHLTEQLLDAIN